MWVQELTFKLKNKEREALKQRKINSSSSTPQRSSIYYHMQRFPKLGYRKYWKLKRDWDGEDEEDAYQSFSLIYNLNFLREPGLRNL